MLQGFSAEFMPNGNVEEIQAKRQKYMTMMDSMTRRIMRIARGSIYHLKELMEMLNEYKRFAKMMSKMSNFTRTRSSQQMSNAIPPQMLMQMGGLQNLMKQMGTAAIFGGGKK